MKNKKQNKIILASGSPRRKEIMKMTGLKFDVSPSFFDEDSLDICLPPKKYVMEMAKRKAGGVSVKYRDAVIIAADTIVVCGNKIIGKPKTKKEAVKILKFCRNKTSAVLTGVSIVDTKIGKTKNFVDCAKIKMRNYDDEAIKDYVATGRPLEVAGAFAIQDKDWVKSIKGSFFSIVGFPILRVLKALEEFGIKLEKKKVEKIRNEDKYIFSD